MESDHHSDQSNENPQKVPVIVISVPYTVQSHLNQLLHLSCLIAARKIPVYYAGSSSTIRQAKLRFNNKNQLDVSQIRFLEFSIPPFPSLSPDPNSPFKFPFHLGTSLSATYNLREPLTELFRAQSLVAKRVVILYDGIMGPIVQDCVSIPNAESYVFSATPPFSSLFDNWEMTGKSFPLQPPIGLPSIQRCYPSEVIDPLVYMSSFESFAAGNLYNSCRLIEGPYLDLLQEQKKKPVFAIGPLNCSVTLNVSSGHGCLRWLDRQDPASVLYISFGTLICFSDEEIAEIAHGLEKSKQKFIWVLREADKVDIFAGDERKLQLPKGFEERVKDVGIIVRDWAPQLEILAHPSVGGFMSHCGWNSCFESITMGVPMLVWPINTDQPKNAFFIKDILKVGLDIVPWSQREKLVITSSDIAKAIISLMASNDGEEMRKKAAELGEILRGSMGEGGVSRKELDSFVAHITR